MRAFWRSFRISCGILALLAALFPLVSGAEELPADLKQDLQKLRAQFERIESRMARIDANKVDQSIREVEIWVDEFSLDAELLDDDPLLVELKKSVADLRTKAKQVAEQRAAEMAKAKAENKQVERIDVEKFLKVKVDLNNVSFKRDVAPIIADVCMRCHNSQRASGEFNASTFNSFAALVQPGDPENSHVLNLVTGKAEPRMPRGGQTTFTQEWIDIWTAWIKQGAKFDGTNKAAPITEYMIDLDTQRRQVLAQLSTEQLEKLHRSEAQRHLDIVNPKKQVHAYEAPNVLSFTTLSEGDAEYIAWLAEAVLEELRLAFDVPGDKLFRGRLGVYVFADRFDYLAFAQEIDGYSPEASQYGHVRLRPEYQYVAITADQAGYALDGMVAQQVAAAFLEQLGNRRLPPWAVYGYSRYIASKMEGRQKSQAFREELQHAVDLAAGGKNMLAVFWENAPWVEMAPLSASFFDFATRADQKKTIAFLKNLANSGNVQGAIQQSFGSSPQQVSAAWLNGLRNSRR